MLIYGAMLRCVDSVLTLASALGHGKSLFVAPQEKREEANAARQEIYQPYTNAKSDHMAIIAAVQAFQQSGLKSSTKFSWTDLVSHSFLQEGHPEQLNSAGSDFSPAKRCPQF